MEESTSKVYVDNSGLAAAMVTEPGTGSALFVINLCASIAPVQIDGKQIPGLDNYRLYQVARVEDGRTRHRLRLGFFTSESHAERVLTVVRQQYPSAFTACLCDEDRKFARGYLPDAATARAPAAKRPIALVNNTTAAAPAAQSKQAAATPAKPAAPAAASTAVVSTAPVARPVPAKAAVTARPAPMPATASARAAAPIATRPAPTAARATSGAATPAAATPAPVAAQAPSTKPAAAKTLTPAEPEVIELTWEPEPVVVKAQSPSVSAAATPRQSATAPDAGLDEFTWEPALKLTLSDPPPPAAQREKPSTEPAQPFHVGRGVQIADAGISLASEPVREVPAQTVASATAAAGNAAAPKKPAASAPAATKPAQMEAPAPAKAKATPAAATPAPAAKTASVKPAPTVPVQTQAPKRSEPPAKAVPATLAAPAASAISAGPAFAAPIAAKPSVAAAAPRGPAPRLPDLDSTQTIRALTSAELSDEPQEKFFAIQLAASEQPVNLDTMPHLDIFEAYRLYSVATAGSGKIVHSLRLGFFKEAVSAEAVAGYLKTFFGSPTVLRVSVAEHTRFKDPPGAKKAEAEPKVEAKVVDFSNARITRPVIPTVTMEVPTPGIDPAATGSFKPNATGSFKASATGSFKTGNTGSFNTSASGSFNPNATGAFDASATGSHKALKPAAMTSGAATKRSAAVTRTKTGTTGKHKALQPKKSLSEQLLEEARQVELSESGIRKLPKNDSLLSRLVGKLTK